MYSGSLCSFAVLNVSSSVFPKYSTGEEEKMAESGAAYEKVDSTLLISTVSLIPHTSPFFLRLRFCLHPFYALCFGSITCRPFESLPESTPVHGAACDLCILYIMSRFSSESTRPADVRSGSSASGSHGLLGFLKTELDSFVKGFSSKPDVSNKAYSPLKYLRTMWSIQDTPNPPKKRQKRSHEAEQRHQNNTTCDAAVLEAELRSIRDHTRSRYSRQGAQRDNAESLRDTELVLIGFHS